MKIHRAAKREKEQAAGSRGSGEGKAPRADEAPRDPPAEGCEALAEPLSAAALAQPRAPLVKIKAVAQKMVDAFFLEIPKE